MKNMGITSIVLILLVLIVLCVSTFFIINSVVPTTTSELPLSEETRIKREEYYNKLQKEKVANEKTAKEAGIYKLTLTKRGADVYGKYFSEFIANILSIDNKSLGAFPIFVHIENNKQIHDILKENERVVVYVDLSEIDQYKFEGSSNEKVGITMELAQPEVLPYLNDTKYCESDSDCSIRTDYCNENSFNHYQKLIEVYGCEGPSGEFDEVNNCMKKVNYSNPHCKDNACSADTAYSVICTPLL